MKHTIILQNDKPIVNQLADGFANIEKHDCYVQIARMTQKTFDFINNIGTTHKRYGNETWIWTARIELNEKLIDNVVELENKDYD